MARKSAYESCKVFRPVHRPPLHPRKYFWYLFLYIQYTVFIITINLTCFWYLSSKHEEAIAISVILFNNTAIVQAVTLRSMENWIFFL